MYHSIQFNLSRFRSFVVGSSRIKLYLNRINPDIVHTQGFRADFLSCYLNHHPVRFSSLRNMPIVDYRLLYGKYLGLLLSWFHYFALRKIPRVVACSDTVGMHGRKHGINIDVVRNGVDLSKGQKIIAVQDKLKIRERLQISDKEMLFVCACPIIPRKSPELLIEAFAPIDPHNIANLVVLGGGSLLDHCQCKAAQYKNIRFLGHVSNVDPYLMAADGYISASKSEGLSNSILEALSWGLPVLLSDIPSHREILAKQPLAGQFFPTDNVSSLSRLIFDFSPTKEAAKSAIAIVNDDFNAVRMSETYQEHYTQALATLT